MAGMDRIVSFESLPPARSLSGRGVFDPPWRFDLGQRMCKNCPGLMALASCISRACRLAFSRSARLVPSPVIFLERDRRENLCINEIPNFCPGFVTRLQCRGAACMCKFTAIAWA